MLPTSGAPIGRYYHTAVWATTAGEMIVWGGYSATVGCGGSCVDTSYYNTGGRYSPSANSWRPMAGSPLQVRRNAVSVWTGSEMIVHGGDSSNGRWDDGARYNPSTNLWTMLPTSGAPTGRGGTGGKACATWTGSEMIIWGGYDSVVGFTNTGARYNPSTNAWTTMSTVGAPSARVGQACAQNGSRLLVWGGEPGAYLNDGGIYDAATGTWSAISTVGAPIGRRNAGAVWTGSEFIVWGGYGSSGYLNVGGRYTP